MDPGAIVHTYNDRHQFKVHRSAYVDPEIFAAEKERIFNSSWLYVGHLSEIDQPGDFVTRRVAGRDLVLSRDSTGVMRCFLNACPHRGAKIVREKTGNARRDRKSVGEGKRVSVRVDLGGRRNIQNKTKKHT